ncbi:hypothetical protein LJR290_007648 [Variovorax sp. LjRoot290]|uniref:hypothetical protein n=1 Tax=Variovorax sp. LjRoot290 TaxID=3342316 RepID=UPI003ECFB698
MTAAAVNAALLELWERQNPQPTLWPMMHEEIAPDGFVSVGLNPSFSEDGTKGWAHLRSDPELAQLWKGPVRISRGMLPTDLTSTWPRRYVLREALVSIIPSTRLCAASATRSERLIRWLGTTLTCSS